MANRSLPAIAAIAGVLASSAYAVSAFSAVGVPTVSADWPYYHGDPAGTHYSALEQINKANVAKLQVAWTYDTGDAFGSGASQSDMQGNPLIVGGRMFIVSPKGRLICLDAESGREIWAYNPSADPVATRQRLRGVSYWRGGGDERILFTFGSDLISVDAKTGTPDPRFGDKGRVDMRRGLDRPIEELTVNNVTPGAVWGDLIVMGSTGATPGNVRAFDVRTGKIRWSFHTIPHPGEPGYETWPKDAWKTEIGANVWAGFAIDRERGIVYLPTASGGMLQRDFYGPTRQGTNRFANSIVALDIATGKLLWDFQAVHHDLWDRDFPTQPTLVTVKRGNRSIPAIAQASKSGWLFILDRVTGKPLFPIVEHRVPPSDVPGEAAWPTQPLPSAPAPFGRQEVTADGLTNRTPEAHAAVLKHFQALRSGGQFVPPSLQGTLMVPGTDGGAEWGGAAYDPDTGLIYVNANEMAWVLKLKPRPVVTAAMGAGRALYVEHCSACHGEDMKGSPPAIPGLTGVGARLSDTMIAHQIVAGGGRMPGFGAVLQPAQVQAMVSYLTVGDDKPAAAGNEGDGGRAASRLRRSDPYVFDGYNRFLDPDGYPGIAPPWGTLSAIDVSTGRYVWKIPFGEYPELAAKGLRNTGSENYGGAVVTKGGLLFIGATNYDRKFHAYDKRSGKLLWETMLPAAGNATPATYAVNGRQFVVIAAGGGKDPKTPPGGKIIAYALPAGNRPR